MAEPLDFSKQAFVPLVIVSDSVMMAEMISGKRSRLQSSTPGAKAPPQEERLIYADEPYLILLQKGNAKPGKPARYAIACVYKAKMVYEGVHRNRRYPIDREKVRVLVPDFIAVTLETKADRLEMVRRKIAEMPSAFTGPAAAP